MEEKRYLIKIQRILNNQRGQTFLENALYIIIVVFILAGCAYTLANTAIKAKFTGIQTEVTGTTVPDITP